ncbi:hypothetical protein CCHL11_08122 [Colletotrichum chlorophyti]|uniref:Uncharacterized protein n=1 Tax=Colletotrichum chlorophyti TaxID=708187 RepID=A0A1Q8S1E6_9PEZI|nr:hypothetical protein CCHL11_08122 [Colletotrichum chlorophyti]
MVHVANAVIREAEQSAAQPNMPPSNEWCFYLDLCLTGLQDLSFSFPLARGMVGMALRRAVIKPSKAKRVLRELQQVVLGHDLAQQRNDKAEARWLIDLGLAITDPEAAQGWRIAEQLEQLMLSKDLTADDSD